MKIKIEHISLLLCIHSLDCNAKMLPFYIVSNINYRCSRYSHPHLQVICIVVIFSFVFASVNMAAKSFTSVFWMQLLSTFHRGGYGGCLVIYPTRIMQNINIPIWNYSWDLPMQAFSVAHHASVSEHVHLYYNDWQFITCYSPNSASLLSTFIMHNGKFLLFIAIQKFVAYVYFKADIKLWNLIINLYISFNFMG